MFERFLGFFRLFDKVLILFGGILPFLSLRDCVWDEWSWIRRLFLFFWAVIILRLLLLFIKLSIDSFKHLWRRLTEARWGPSIIWTILCYGIVGKWWLILDWMIFMIVKLLDFHFGIEFFCFYFIVHRLDVGDSELSLNLEELKDRSEGLDVVTLVYFSKELFVQISLGCLIRTVNEQSLSELFFNIQVSQKILFWFILAWLFVLIKS